MTGNSGGTLDWHDDLWHQRSWGCSVLDKKNNRRHSDITDRWICTLCVYIICIYYIIYIYYYIYYIYVIYTCIYIYIYILYIYTHTWSWSFINIYIYMYTYVLLCCEIKNTYHWFCSLCLSCWSFVVHPTELWTSPQL